MQKKKLYFYKSLTSTNEKIKEINKKNKMKNSSIGLFTELQTRGKGRGDNNWLSKKGDLTCSFLFEKNFSVFDFGKINILVTLIIVKELSNIFPDLVFKLKWPNDIYLNNKKVGGILIENSIIKKKINYTIIGLGLNLISNPVVTSYSTICISKLTKIISPKIIFKKIFNVLENEMNNNFLYDFEKKRKEWLNFAKDLGNSIIIKNKKKIIEGTFVSINSNGELVINSLGKKKIIKY